MKINKKSCLNFPQGKYVGRKGEFLFDILSRTVKYIVLISFTFYPHFVPNGT